MTHTRHSRREINGKKWQQKTSFDNVLHSNRIVTQKERAGASFRVVVITQLL